MHDTTTTAFVEYELTSYADQEKLEAEERRFKELMAQERREQSAALRQRHDFEARNVFRNAYLRHDSFKRTRARRRVF